MGSGGKSSGLGVRRTVSLINLVNPFPSETEENVELDGLECIWTIGEPLAIETRCKWSQELYSLVL